MDARAGEPLPYFERAATRGIVLGSFFVVFLPLLALRIAFGDAPWVTGLTLVEVIGLGVTHFFITLVVYFQSANLDHFASSGRNRFVFFVAPAAILIVFAALGAGDVREHFPMFAATFFGCVRFLDFFHVGRQSFGMLQIFKRPLGDVAPAWLRAAENTFFVAMAALQWESFVLGGRFANQALYAWLPAGALLVLSLVIASGYLRAPPRARRKAALPLAYFAMQALCAATAAWRTDLYLVALTLHYVEYHVIMLPRWRQAPLDATRTLDRAFAPMQRRPWLFYAILLAIVLIFEQREAVAATSAASRLLVHAFDGIFVVHYVVDAFLWRFREPYFQRTLAPLYAPARGAGPESAPRATSSEGA